MSNVTIGGINYELNSPVNGEATVSNNTGITATAVTIPLTVIDGSTTYTVTTISPGAFQNNAIITSVIISASVSSIETSAFENCTNLTSVTLPTNPAFTTIKNTFKGCTKLTSVIIPNCVTTIGTANNTNSGPFLDCTSLTTVTIPSSVTSITHQAFCRCNLSSLNLSSNLNLTYIGINAFNGNANLSSVQIPSSVTRIDVGAFDNCNNLSSVYFEGTVLPTFEIYAFKRIGLGSPSTAYYKYGTNITNLRSNNWFTYYVVSNPPCFKEGSKVLTSLGYKKVEELRKGDLVKTLDSGYKGIYMIGKKKIKHEGVEERLKGQLYKCSRENYPEVWEDLVITGCHSILVSNFKSEEEKEKAIEVNNNRLCLTEGKYRLPACADMRAKVYEVSGEYTIYHVALENEDNYMNYGIYANGLLVETCSKRYLKELSGMEEV